jgi:ankyrin repeat protein
MAELLIQHGADVGSRDTTVGLLCIWRRVRGHVKMAELLIQHGADVGSRDNEGWTPLHAASQGGHVKMAELLIQHGADVGSRDKRLDSFAFGIISGPDVLCRMLIQRGADVGSRAHNGRTPLHRAALKGHLDTVKLLLECGADRNIRDEKNRTPLDLASDNEKLEVANFLSLSAMSLDGEANPTPPLINPQNQRSNVVQSPRRHGGNVVPSNNEQPSLYTAAENGQVDVVRLLLDQGSNVEERNGSRQTALAVASRFGQLEVAKLLIERGANVNSREQDRLDPATPGVTISASTSCRACSYLITCRPERTPEEPNDCITSCLGQWISRLLSSY